MKKVLLAIFQPLKFFAGRQFAEKVSIYFTKHKAMLYVLSFVITLAIIFIVYILPEIKA